jgi:hypothetical protein
MGIDSLAVEGVNGRQRTNDLIATDRGAALRVARSIRHPWYRCQALAALAGAEPGARKRDELLDESLSAAYEQSEPNRIVVVATWPLAHLVRVDPAKARSVVSACSRSFLVSRMDCASSMGWLTFSLR